MGTPHKATAEEWAWQEEWAKEPHADQDSSCILELRSRIEALEAAANPTPEQSPAAPAPAGGLVEGVCNALEENYSMEGAWDAEACAAILAVAEWLEANSYGASAAWAAANLLREEAQRHG